MTSHPTDDQLATLQATLRQQGVHTLLAQFVDMHGTPKGKWVPLDHLRALVREGAGFAGPSIAGTGLPRTGPRSEYYARVVTGTAASPRPGPATGWYTSPTVLDGVTAGMTVAREEVFGPVLAVLTAEDVEEAVALANDTEYGLAASVWTRDVSLAHRVSRRLRAGTVWVNCYEEGDMTVPFGGYKQSGNGRDKSLHAFDKYTELKTTWIRIDGQK